MKTMPKKILIGIVTACLIQGMAVAGETAAAVYDVVILNGRVMDSETNVDGIRFGSRENYEDTVNEFTARAKWFTPVEILKQATSINAELPAITGPRNPYTDGPLCVIQEGAYADLLIIDGNPLDHISIVADPEKNFRIIMKDGKVYKKAL